MPTERTFIFNPGVSFSIAASVALRAPGLRVLPPAIQGAGWTERQPEHETRAGKWTRFGKSFVLKKTNNFSLFGREGLAIWGMMAVYPIEIISRPKVEIGVVGPCGPSQLESGIVSLRAITNSLTDT